MAYPGSLDSFPTNTDGVDDVLAADMNAVQTAALAIETELGTDPAGTATDVKTRLDQSQDGVGNIEFKTPTELTISAGSITITQNYHVVDTEADAASDDLDSIVGGAEGFILVIRAADDARTVVVKDATGSPQLLLAGDMTLDHSQDTLTLLKVDASNWIETSRSNNAA